MSLACLVFVEGGTQDLGSVMWALLPRHMESLAVVCGLLQHPGSVVAALGLSCLGSTWDHSSLTRVQTFHVPCSATDLGPVGHQ